MASLSILLSRTCGACAMVVFSCMVLTSVVSARLVPMQQAAPPVQSEDEPKYTGDPYLLDVCAVSGEKIDLSKAVRKVIRGREVAFCCAGCIKSYETSIARYEHEMDKILIERQKAYYPLDVCPLMDEPLIVDGKDTAKNVIFGNRLVRLCCGKCVRRFESRPEKLLKQLDEEVKKQQGPKYPLTTCLVDGATELTEENTVEFIIGNRLMRVSDKAHVATVRGAAATYIKKIDDAWKSSGTKPTA